MNKPYVENTPLSEILIDGWSRGFGPEQTLAEADAMDFELTREELDAAWDQLEQEMVGYFDDIPF